ENDSIINATNIDEAIVNDRVQSRVLLDKLKKENEPIIIEYVPGKFQYLFYGNSSLLNKLKYYPIALLLIIVLFGAVVYNFYRSTKMATQNKLWAGMAKETAHQIGTPLSSLIGWLEIMKADNVDETTVTEIEKVFVRLLHMPDRVSKIGAASILATRLLVEEAGQVYDYLKSNFTTAIDITFSAPEKKIMVALNPVLHSWTIEYLGK